MLVDKHTTVLFNGVQKLKKAKATLFRRELANIAKETVIKAATIKSCYACDEPATSTEHVPPLSFFPKGNRDNFSLRLVRAVHNNANSMDVEYTWNIICTFFGVSDVGQRHFPDKAMRSFDSTPALLQTTFSDIRPVNIRRMQAGAFTTKVHRITVVMSACLTALHFRETAEKVQHWEIMLPSRRR